MNKSEKYLSYDDSSTIVYGYKCTGSSHIREKKNCQDAYKIWDKKIKGKEVYIIAVGDGHGSKNYDLSEFGSQIVVETIVDELVKFYQYFLDNKEELGQKFDMLKMLKSDFPKLVVRKWKENVIKHYESYYGMDNAIIDESEKIKIIKRYGTTGLFAFIVPEGVVIGQIGDGDILIVNEEKVESPLPVSNELIANVTYSMTSKEAHFLWNINQINIESRTMLILSTDGLSNSYARDENFFLFARSLFDNISSGDEKKDIKKLNIPSYIEKASFNGSGDDITIVFAIIDPKMFIR